MWLVLASILLSLAVPLALGGFSQFALLHRLPWWAALVLALLAFISWGFNSLRTQILVSALGQSISLVRAALTTMAAEFAGGRRHRRRRLRRVVEPLPVGPTPGLQPSGLAHLQLLLVLDPGGPHFPLTIIPLALKR